ncbi:MAG: hypothetical protein GY737_21020 [Desulfobacteraceae bacterium]|nr:hypothetical protein [Desulfobacteraceae bacterium]
MTEINYNDLAQFLATEKPETLPRLFLAFGEEFLTRKAFDRIIDRLVPKEKRELSYELLEGVEAALPNVMERISTYSFEELLVVAVKNAPIFSGPGTQKQPGFSKPEIEAFQEFIKTPFPDGHFLVLTTDSGDKRRALYKAIKGIGLVVDCTVPKGSRQADKNQQTVLLRTTMEAVLSKSGKGMANDAFACLVDHTGFDPSTFSDNLEKLVSFIGERKRITADDVNRVVKRTRKDAIFELTNAVSERNPSTALFFLKSLLKGGFHPLQILTALINQMRKLVLVKLFVADCRAKGMPGWQRGMDYNRFRQEAMPVVERADAAVAAKAKLWEDTLAVPGEGEPKKKKKVLTDLLIAPNKKNTYPVYHTFLKSDKFTLEELFNALIQLNEVDLKMKSSANDPEIMLDDLVIRLCTKGEIHE